MVCRSLVEQFSQTYKEQLTNHPEYAQRFLFCNHEIVGRGLTFCYLNCCRVITAFLTIEETSGDVYMMEAILPGRFTKYIGNQGEKQNQYEESAPAICMALVHWSLIFSNGDFIITDLQGILSTLSVC